MQWGVHGEWRFKVNGLRRTSSRWNPGTRAHLLYDAFDGWRGAVRGVTVWAMEVECVSTLRYLGVTA